MTLFDSVLVANRGEIAVRIIRTLRALGIRSVALFTEPDRDAAHVRAADIAADIGDPSAYLDIDAIMAVAVQTGADAVHPGYGFLSENPQLAEACAHAGITFVGPPPSALTAMGDKINAKQLVSSSGVPVVPGRDGRSLDDEGLVAAALDVGLPVLLKPSAGGGGKGMRRVDDPDSLLEAIRASRREAITSFGDGTLLVERFITTPRHVEVQVLADSHGHVVALGERECSLQRRHQKIVEETPSPLLDAETRASMQSAAVSAAKACGYVNAGTVEFIVSSQRADEFFFMEMNTRLQVEHPVTEMVRGLDLVEWQLRIAAGERLPWENQEAVPPPRGHAVEARVYAEDPARGFLPSTGRVREYREPQESDVRVDSGVQAGVNVGTDYDPLLAKVIAWAPNRDQALARLRNALSETAIVGLRTNVGYLQRLLRHPLVVAGEVDTGLVERVHQELARPAGDERWVAGTAAILDEIRSLPPGAGPWEQRDAWRVVGPASRISRWILDDQTIEVSLSGRPTEGWVSWDGTDPVSVRVRMAGDKLLVEVGYQTRKLIYAMEGDRFWLSVGGESWELTRERETVGHAGPAGMGPGPVNSPMPGTVLAVHVQVGEDVAAGQPLVTVEAMKMEHVVVAPIEGSVANVLVSPGERVVLNQPLAEISGEGST